MKELRANILPETVFRFRPNNTKHDFGEELMKAVNFHQVWCSPLNGQNDPFDSLPHYKMSSYEEILRYVNVFQRKHGTDISFTGRNMREMALENGVVNEADIVRLTSPEFLAKQAEKIAFDALVESRNHSKIACFSESIDSILMWSHYANAHQGVCLEYEIPANSEGSYAHPKLMQVTYSSRRPKVTLVEVMKYLGSQNTEDQTLFSEDQVRQVLECTHLTKSEQWEYEKEWRWIEYDEGAPRYRVMLPIKVKSITVGERASDDTIALCKDVINAGKGVPIYKVKLSASTFSFEREEI